MSDSTHIKPLLHVEVIHDKHELSLSDLKRWFKKNRQASMRELCWRYDEEASVIYAMLQHFICRGQLQTSMMTPKCGSKCQQCPAIEVLKFEWKNG